MVGVRTTGFRTFSVLRYIHCDEDAVGFLYDSVFGQITELHVTEGFPWTDHGDVCSKTLHAGDVVSESDKEKTTS